METSGKCCVCAGNLIDGQAWKDLLVFLATFLCTLILGVELGIGIGMVLSILLVIKQNSLSHIELLGQLPDTKKFKSKEKFPAAQIIPVSC